MGNQNSIPMSLSLKRKIGDNVSVISAMEEDDFYSQFQKNDALLKE